MTASAVLDHVLDTLGGDDPAAVLKELNRLLRTTLHNDTSDSPIDNGLDIGFCWFTPSRRRLVFAGARMDLYRVSKGTLERIVGDKQSIGYRGSNVHFAYTNHSVEIEESMMFYLASDGILDQAGGPRGWGFGRKRFHACLESISGLPASEQKATLDRTLADYQGHSPQRDDITVIGFRF